MSAEASELVSIPRAELEALKAELKRLRREVGRVVAEGAFKAILVRVMRRPPSPARTLPRRGEYVSDRLVRFPDTSWQEIEALPQPLRWTVQRTIFHLLDEPVPTLADPFPRDDPLPGAYELHLPTDDVTIWYTITEYDGQEVISVQHVSLET